jgi:hypothetical protein
MCMSVLSPPDLSEVIVAAVDSNMVFCEHPVIVRFLRFDR